MRRKTAMQELHSWLVDKWSDPSKMLSCHEVCLKIEELLPIEKQQKCNDFSYGYMHGSEPLNHSVIDKWYNQTYEEIKI
jgi:hypothetical protein